MLPFGEEEIRDYLKMHRITKAEYHQLQETRRLRGDILPLQDLKRMFLLAKQCSMVETWLAMLSEDESYVLKRHLIDELDFKRVEVEYRERWGEFAKTDRTLRRYQRTAIQKIQRFMIHNKAILEGESTATEANTICSN